MSGVRRQGCYWLGTISKEQGWEPGILTGIVYLRGQLECGEGGFEHYQVFFITARKHSTTGVKKLFAPVVGHWELTRSAASESYVWKEASRIGEPFEFGSKPFKRNSNVDWDLVRQCAVGGDHAGIPSDIYVRYYFALRAITADHLRPVAVERQCSVYWGRTGAGKSRQAWEEAGTEAYSKDPRTKFWCGYSGQECVVIDEFRGGIDISHILRWTDRYPVRVEVKGSSRPLCAKRIWITSNLHPSDWYPEVDIETFKALKRRLEIKNFE